MAFMRSPVRSRSGPPSFPFSGHTGAAAGRRVDPSGDLGALSDRISAHLQTLPDTLRWALLHGTADGVLDVVLDSTICKAATRLRGRDR